MPRDTEPRSALSGQQIQNRELLILAELSGIHADPTIYRIIAELLNMQIEPEVIYKLLRSIRKSSKYSKPNSDRF